MHLSRTFSAQTLAEFIPEDASLALAREGNDQALATSFATIAGRTSEEPLEGTVLEACIQHGNRYLLFLTDDIPFEDSLHIHLLDEDLNRIDTVTLGAPYTTGHFRNLKCDDFGGLTFEFSRIVCGRSWCCRKSGYGFRLFPARKVFPGRRGGFTFWNLETGNRPASVSGECW